MNINHACYVVPPHMMEALVKRGVCNFEMVDFRSQRRLNGTIAKNRNNLLALGSKDARLNRIVYDAENRSGEADKIARKEGSWRSFDKTVNEAYEGSGETWKFYNKFFDRNSIDNSGMDLVSVVHFGRNYNNAFWDGFKMTYGDGDGQIFRSFTKALSVIGHELTHGVVEFAGGLDYVNQSGALNEHIADVFGVLVTQRKLKQNVNQADWLMGAELFGPAFTDRNKDKALRSMKEPGLAYDNEYLGKDPQPWNFRDFLETEMDNGGVHINSGIPNHAFYQAAMLLGGNAWEKAGPIWYKALHDLHNPQANFLEFAELTVKSAEALYGERSLEAQYVDRAWRVVEVL